MKIIVGTKSKLKLNIVKKVFAKYLDKNTEVYGVDISSEVSESPFGKDVFNGAKNRAINARNKEKGDIYIGIESGQTKRYNIKFDETWCCIYYNRKIYYGYSSGLVLPKKVVNEMKDKTHKNAMIKIKKDFDDNKKYSKNTWSNYSNKLISRNISIEESIRNALIPIIASSKSLYK